MAKKFEKGQHLFFLMRGGKTQLDSKKKPMYYLNRDKARQHAKGDSEIIEYAPVQYGQFAHDGPRLAGGVDWWHCGNCGRLVSGAETRFDYCPWCGANMNGGDDDATD